MALSSFPEKSAGRAALSSEVCEDMTGGLGGAESTGPTGVTGGTGSEEASGAGEKGCASWGFLDKQGWVAEVRKFSTGVSSSS